MKGLSRIKAAFTTVLSVALLLSFTSLANASSGAYDYRYTGSFEYGSRANGESTALMGLSDGSGQQQYTYCVDSTVYIANNSKYSRSNLETAGYFTDDSAAAKVRAIVLQSYPSLTIEALRQACHINDLTKGDAIAATQMAIWHYTNGESLNNYNSLNVKALYNWLIALDGVAPTATTVGTIDLQSTSGYDAATKTGTVTFRFKSDALNADNTKVALQYSFDKNIQTQYGATVSAPSVADGWTTVVVSGLPKDASFSMSVRGVQTMMKDAYMYMPEGGRMASQCLVGAYTGTTNLLASMPYTQAIPNTYSLSIYKYDSATQKGIEGAVFQLASNEGFTDPTVYEQTSNAAGMITFSGLTEGIWYLREKTAATGYVPDTKVYHFQVNDVPQDVIRFKNTHYGEIKILKVDETGGPVQGAKFNIYAGNSTDAVNLINSDLVSDENGLILAGSIIPGTYTVLETEAPVGYHLAVTPKAVITVNPHETVTVSMVNKKVIRGKIGVLKQDYESGQQLDGAVVGLYSDSACTNLIAQFTTSKDSVQWQENLLPGTYYVKELKAPGGYILNPTQTIVKVDLDEGEIETVTFRNRPTVDTAGNYGLIALIGGGMLVITGGLAFAFRKKLFKSK